MSIDVMKQALLALEDAVSAWRAEMEFRSCIDVAKPWAEAAEALRAAIEQQEKHEDWCASLTQLLMSMPPKPAPCNCKSKTAQRELRQWQGLTRQEFLDATQGLEDLEDCWMAIEAALRSKNT